MKLSDLNEKKVLILGYGKEGQSTEYFLTHNVPSAEIIVADQKNDPNYLKKQTECDLVVKTPGIPGRFITKPYTTGTNLFHTFLTEHGMKNMIIGVTGSKGKSTTVSLITAILRNAGKTVHLIGNIGTPALDALKQPIGIEDIFVIELSSYQCEDLDWSPHISIITSIFPEHLDYHGGFQEYIDAKKMIVANANSADFLVYNPKYKELIKLASSTKLKTVPFIEKMEFDISSSKLKGEHNLDNIRGAITVARLYGVSDEISYNTISNFEPLPHRMTDIGTYRGIRFIDDAIATAPEPTMFAVETIGNVDTIFLGGEDRGLDFTAFAEFIVKSKIKNIVLFPDTGKKISDLLKQSSSTNKTLNILETRSMEEAVLFAYKYTTPGKTCLLSTASPSYSLWKNFEEKGEEFTRLAKEISLKK